jgi:glycosyltransferase involved in cell wall biosynthesis
VAQVGVFGLNLSPKSGGAYHLIKGLMENAHYSEHSFVYLHEWPSTALPKNVKSVPRSVLNRLAVQGFLRVPCADRILSDRRSAFLLFSLLGSIRPRRLREIDVWLWPHCFSPVPNLKPIVAIFHDMIHRYHPELFTRSVLFRRRRAELSMRHCAAIICPSSVVKDDLIRIYPGFRDKATICWEAAYEMVPRESCKNEIRTIQSLHGTSTLFLYVAVDWPHKNHELLIKAAVSLREMTNYPFKVVFVGSRRSNRIQGLIEEQKAGNLVIDAGGVTQGRLSAYYYAATALVFPSLHEGFGIPLVEAMQCGVPIIASNIASIPEVCGSAAVLLAPDNPNTWAREMFTMMIQNEHRFKYSRMSLERSQVFSWQRCWEKLDKVFSDALSTRDHFA